MTTTKNTPKSVKVTKIIILFIGVALFLHSRALNELQLGFNEAEGFIGLVLIFLSLLRKIRTTIKSLI